MTKNDKGNPSEKLITVKRSPLADKPRKALILAVPLVALVLIGVLWLLISLGNRDSGESPKAEATPSAPATAEAVLPPGKKGDNVPPGTSAQQKKELIRLSSEFMTEAGKISKNITNEKAQAIFKTGDGPELTEKYKDTIVVNSILKEEDLQGLAYLSFVIIAQEIYPDFEQQGLPIQPIVDTPEKNVFLDMNAGVAYVPLSIFRGSETALSINWVYVDGAWKIYPYSFLDGLQTAEIIGSEAAPSSSSESNK